MSDRDTITLAPPQPILNTLDVVILDLDRFVAKENPFWEELKKFLDRQDNQGDINFSLEEAKRFHYLYERASSDLVKLKTFGGEAEITRYLDRLVARSYGRLHEKTGDPLPFRPWTFLTKTFPQTFRRHWIAFALSMGTSLLGGAFGAGALALDYDLKNDFIPPQFSHLNGDPSDRVEKEEKEEFDEFENRYQFSAMLMTHNTKVTVLAMVTGFLWGVFTLIMLFYNGVLIGVVGFDYVHAGESVFLIGWILPHGSFEFPAIFIGGQCGLIIARAMFGWGTNLRLRQRFARIRSDLLTLILGAALFLIWAGIVESFLSQYHAPMFYPFKIGFGIIEVIALVAYLSFCGREKRKPVLVSA